MKLRIPKGLKKMGKGRDTQKMSLQNRQRAGHKGYFVFPEESQKEELLM